MRKFIIAVQVCFLTAASVPAVATYPGGPLIPVGDDAVIFVDNPVAMQRQADNTIVVALAGKYNYDSKCTFVSIVTQASWPNGAGGNDTSVPILFGTPEAIKLPQAPKCSAGVVIPDLPNNTQVTVISILEVTKPNPVNGMPAIKVLENGSGMRAVPKRMKKDDAPLLD